jgi:ABC-2 type transport system permease protein
MRLLKIYWKQCSVNLSREMAYKANFFIRFFITAFADFISPLVILFIYQSTPGVPGWSFPEFILLLGTFTLVMGIGHTLFDLMAWEVLERVQDGTFDSILTKPMRPLTYLTTKAFMFQTLAEIPVGLFLILWAASQIQLGSIWLWLVYSAFVGIGVLFHYSVIILISALAFLVVHSEGLFRMYWRVSDFARYPKEIYTPGLKVFLTFLFPVGIASFQPAEILLHGITPIGAVYIVIPIIIFFTIALLLWRWAMRSYSSAGG